MDEKNNITKKLQEIVKQRKIPIVVNKQATGYKPSKSTSRNIESEGYLYYNYDE
ncbi:MAG: hypothetical protein JXA91_07635 [Candidatus Thermoplasmatota archaeon]|nr:hypothetical protein [Candidatus Thermoplasmatota archaeon]